MPQTNALLSVCIITLAALLLSACATAQVNAKREALPERIAAAAPHPRLLMDAADVQRLHERIASDETSQALFGLVREKGDALLDAEPVTYKKSGKRLLSVSREALRRVLCLSFLYRMTDDTKYADRALRELEATAAFSDWNPSHFLDVAEMTAAFAIGYDWLHPLLDADAEALLRKAILEKGIGPSYDGHGSWAKCDNNWNQVCNGGMLLGALALAEHEPELALRVIERALDGLPYAMRTYDPDGVYAEGPSYWNYGTTYNVLIAAALETALGSDFGIAEAPGFKESGAFPLLMTGPTGLYFNFADCGQRRGPYPAVYWFAQRWNAPGICYFEEQWVRKMLDGEASGYNRFLPLLLLWREKTETAEPRQPLNWKGESANPVAVHRTSWTDPNAVFLAVKAGTPHANHGHMDIGSFVLDAGGVRWALDLGADSYGKLEALGLGIWNRAQGSDRWRIFRYHNSSHSTLTVDGQVQKVTASAPIARFSANKDFPCTIVDMSAVYAGQLERATRGFALLPDGRVLIQDEIAAPDNTASVRWAMTTPGEITDVQPGAATLTQEDKRLHFQVLAPANAAIETFTTDPPPNEWDSPNPGTRQIGFHLSLDAGESATIAVLLTPGTAAQTAPPTLRPLEEWPEE